MVAMAHGNDLGGRPGRPPHSDTIRGMRLSVIIKAPCLGSWSITLLTAFRKIPATS